mmetsp:Transcript_21219/g.53405  ORF Transcript_21219/g.53405 Transcript_21219/m.53405 type:complete len:816 (-) Transcript_21219:126-2573(-)
MDAPAGPAQPQEGGPGGVAPDARPPAGAPPPWLQPSADQPPPGPMSSAPASGFPGPPPGFLPMQPLPAGMRPPPPGPASGAPGERPPPWGMPPTGPPPPGAPPPWAFPPPFPFPGGPPRMLPHPMFDPQEAERRAAAERAGAIAAAWAAHKAPDGRVYYYNSETKESSWVKPEGFMGNVAAVSAQIKPVASHAVPGTQWNEVTTDDGKRYFFNQRTKETSWAVPPEVTLVRSKDPKDPSNVAAVSEAAKAIIARLKANNAGAHLSVGLGEEEDVSYDPEEMGEAALPPTQPATGATGLPGDAPASAIPGPLPPPGSPPKRPDSKEAKEAAFFDLLRETGVTPFSRWEKELPKLLGDPRFSAVPSQKEKRMLFDKFCRMRADEVRNEKKQSSKVAAKGFGELLQEAVEQLHQEMERDAEEGEAVGDGGERHIPKTTTLASLAKRWGKDPRWKAASELERRKLYAEVVQPLVDAAAKHEAALLTAATEGFKALLSDSGVSVRSRWRDVKDKVSRDPRYRAVPRDSREEIFKSLVAELQAAAEAARREQSIRDGRQEEARRRMEKEEVEGERRQRRAAQSDAVSAFQTLLVEVVKDPEARWADWWPKLQTDAQGRATDPALGGAPAEKLFREHVGALMDKGMAGFAQLMQERLLPVVQAQAEDPGADRHPALETFEAARELLDSDLRFSRAPRSHRERLWHRYVSDSLSNVGLPPPPPLRAPSPPRERDGRKEKERSSRREEAEDRGGRRREEEPRRRESEREESRRRDDGSRREKERSRRGRRDDREDEEEGELGGRSGRHRERDEGELDGHKRRRH